MAQTNRNIKTKRWNLTPKQRKNSSTKHGQQERVRRYKDTKSQMMDKKQSRIPTNFNLQTQHSHQSHEYYKMTTSTSKMNPSIILSKHRLLLQVEASSINSKISRLLLFCSS